MKEGVLVLLRSDVVVLVGLRLIVLDLLLLLHLRRRHSAIAERSSAQWPRVKAQRQFSPIAFVTTTSDSPRADMSSRNLAGRLVRPLSSRACS